jgi:zinc transporter ZupT
MLQTICLGLLASLAEVLGGSFVILKAQWPRKTQEYILALSAGFLLALVFLDLIPASLQKLGTSGALYVLVGYAVLHFFEHTVVGHFHFGEETHAEVMISPLASVSAFSGLAIHSFFDGISISAGMQFSPVLGMLIFIAILLHKIPEGLTVASIMLAAGKPKMFAFYSSLAVAVATLLGIVTVFLLSNISSQFVGIAFAFSAGAATYVGASDLVPEINHSGNRITPVVVFAGMAIFALSQWIVDSVFM